MTKRLLLLLHAACTTFLLAPASAQDLDQGARLRATIDAGGRVGALRTADDSIHAEGPAWQANFSTVGAVFEVEAGANGDEIAALHLRYLGARRGDTWSAADDASRPDLGDRIVRTQHGDVVETYTLRRGGIEQSFHIGERPDGSGDLVIEIATAGNVQAAATVDFAHRALEFRLADAGAIRYGEAIAFDRTGRRIDVQTHYDGAGRIQLRVPGEFVDTANYPLVVDPIVGSLIQSGAGTDNDSSPDVAHDVVQDRFLVVWQRSFASTRGIRGAIYDGNGTVQNSLITIADGVGYGAPAAAFTRTLNTNMFFVVWEQPTGIHGRLLSAFSGSMPATSFPISSPAVGEQDRRPAVSGPDGAMMVAWDRTDSGETQPQRIVLRDVYWLLTFDPTSTNIGPERTLETVGTGSVSRVRLARSNVAPLVSGTTWYANRAVWQRFYTSPAPGDSDVRTTSFRMKRAPFEFVTLSGPNGVAGAADVGPNEINPDIGSRASLYQDPTDVQFLVAWEDENDVLGQMFDLLGPTGSNFTVRATSDYEGQPAVGAGFCEFTVAYLQITPPAEFDVDVYAARVLLDGTVAEDHRLVDNPGSQYQERVRASSRPILTSAAFERNTSLLAWMGQTGPAGTGLNDVRARFFEPVAASTSFFGAACPGPLGELPQIIQAGGAPVPGNGNYAVGITNAPANSLVALMVGTSLINVPIPGAPGCFLYTDLPLITLLPAITSPTGGALISLPMPCSLPLSPIAMQWGVYTPGWNAFGWITSNDLDVNWFD